LENIIIINTIRDIEKTKNFPSPRFINAPSNTLKVCLWVAAKAIPLAINIMPKVTIKKYI